MTASDKRPKYYALVADHTRAKVFRVDSGFESLQVVYDQLNFQGQRSARPHGSRPAGASERTVPPLVAAGPQAIETLAETDMEFIRDLCKLLKASHQAGQFQHLIIIAPASFLTAFRGEAGADCRKTSTTIINGNLTKADNHSVLARIKTALATEQGK